MVLDFENELADATLVRFTIEDAHGESYRLELRGKGIERFRKDFVWATQLLAASAAPAPKEKP